jgi:hypothetical protein
MSKDQPGVVYPRFLGVDSNGDFVWELASGRWTWGDDPYQANQRQRTFTADRYLDKYGPVTQLPESGLLGHSAVPADQPGAIVSPAGWCAPAGARTGISPEALDAAVAEAFEDGKRRGAESVAVPAPTDGERKVIISQVLYSLLVNLDGWIEGARSNHDGLGHRGESVGDECWTRWAPADFRSMINDVAREFGVSEFPRPEVAKEDEVR